MWESPVVENMVLAYETMSPGDRTNKPAVGHVREGGEVGVLPTGWGDGAAALNPSLWFTVVRVG